MNKDYSLEEILNLLESIKNHNALSTMLSTFISSFQKNTLSPDPTKPDEVRLYGSFNLGGTLSGRLSSSSPNLQNIPSTGTPYAKPVKECFRAPAGWLMVGADFNALEERVGSLLTKDPNRLKVYHEGFDGHCLRAYAYFGDKMPDIRQATDQERCFKLQAGKDTVYCKADDVLVLPDGTRKTVQQLFEEEGYGDKADCQANQGQ
jgi:DNA polymerase I-like protein with 3'-5' exonuclease and polymerase domains